MDIISWNDRYCVNIESIDNQHKMLFEKIDIFYDSLGKKTNKEILTEILYQLNRYSDYHFQTEEGLMKKYGYRDFENHKNEHVQFISKINEIQKRLDEGKMVLTVELTNFLRDWLKKHISISDKAYSHFLNECGVK